MYNSINKLASSIYNDVVSGLLGYHTNPSISLELLEDEIIDTRLLVLKEYSLKGILPAKDLYVSINCIPVDCQDLERCSCKDVDSCFSTPTAHFLIPQIVNDYGALAIEYLGSTDRLSPFIYYSNYSAYKNRKYRKRGKDKPFVWIDTTPNKKGMCDCYIFNAPFIEMVSISAIFKDVRQLEEFSCCSNYLEDNKSFINQEVRNRLVLQKLRYYRLYAMPPKLNDLQYTA